MFIFRYPKLLFRISEIFISDIQNNYSGYQKLCKKGVLFEISKKSYFGYQKQQFRISENKHLVRILICYFIILLFWTYEIVISDIWNSFLDI